MTLSGFFKLLSNIPQTDDRKGTTSTFKNSQSPLISSSLTSYNELSSAVEFSAQTLLRVEG